MSAFKHYDDGKLPNLTAPKFDAPDTYFISKGLKGAIDVALQLNLPLLLTGEPGTGKTQLAHHLAHRFGLGKALVFNAQTTSQARDLFYRYDALAHFQASQTLKEKVTAADFVQFQALGEAIKTNEKRVVLLDEIDKAPRDFPNDILAAIEDMAFKVAETGVEYAAASENRPFVVLTSNSEKNLPDAFLRRVAYFHIAFPEKEDLLRILSAKIGGYETADLDCLIDHFELIRSGKVVKMRKNPATAELINWVFLLKSAQFPAEKLAEIEDLTASERAVLIQSYAVLAKSRDDLRDIQKILRG